MILAGGIAGLLVTGSILLVFLWKPMNRIRQLATALPISGAATAALRNALPLRRGIAADEIDIVVDSVKRLSDDLESAHSANRGRAEPDVAGRSRPADRNLFNRRRFQEVFDRILALSVRYQRTGALLFLDLDQFKYVNDLSGHQAGDALCCWWQSGRVMPYAIPTSWRASVVTSSPWYCHEAQADGVYMANKLQHELRQVEFARRMGVNTRSAAA